MGWGAQTADALAWLPGWRAADPDILSHLAAKAPALLPALAARFLAPPREGPAVGPAAGDAEPARAAAAAARALRAHHATLAAADLQDAAVQLCRLVAAGLPRPPGGQARSDRSCRAAEVGAAGGARAGPDEPRHSLREGGEAGDLTAAADAAADAAAALEALLMERPELLERAAPGPADRPSSAGPDRGRTPGRALAAARALHARLSAAVAAQAAAAAHPPGREGQGPGSGGQVAFSHLRARLTLALACAAPPEGAAGAAAGAAAGDDSDGAAAAGGGDAGTHDVCVGSDRAAFQIDALWEEMLAPPPAAARAGAATAARGGGCSAGDAHADGEPGADCDAPAPAARTLLVARLLATLVPGQPDAWSGSNPAAHPSPPRSPDPSQAPDRLPGAAAALPSGVLAGAPQMPLSCHRRQRLVTVEQGLG
jgi:hypothetical protein